MSGTPRTFRASLIYSFSYIKMQAKTEDVNVTKLVDFVARILKHISLHFSDFFMIF